MGIFPLHFWLYRSPSVSPYRGHLHGFAGVRLADDFLAPILHWQRLSLDQKDNILSTGYGRKRGCKK